MNEKNTVVCVIELPSDLVKSQGAGSSDAPITPEAKERLTTAFQELGIQSSNVQFHPYSEWQSRSQSAR